MERLLFLPTRRRFASWGEEQSSKPKLPIASGAAWLGELNTLIQMKKKREQETAENVA